MPSQSNRRKACVTSDTTLRILSFLALIVLGCSSAQANWEEKFFNPNPMADDVILPMPCEGSMVFRRVEIPLSKPLDDYSITLGQEGGDWGFMEQAFGTHIAGSFTSSDSTKSRYYLLAKYELNQLQYQALTSSSCPTPSLKLRLPQYSVSWFDAVAMADRYNLWLQENAKEQLPKEDGSNGFLRLPTETEWEFAARGGIAVSAADFREDRFPMPEGINAYAWFAGAQSANGKPQLTGLSKANPLGLHDMLGNLDEIVFEPFRLNKLDRMHGQSGGFIVRGGNYLTPMGDIRSSLRREEPYYLSGQHNAPKVAGFRLAMVAPALTSRNRIKQIEQEWKALGTQSGKQTDNAAKNVNPVDELSTLANTVEDTKLKQQLDKLRSELRANIQVRDEQRDRAIRSSLQLGAFLCTKLKDDGLFYDHLTRFYKLDCDKTDADTNICDKRKAQLENHKNTLDFILNYYADTVVDAGLNYDQQLIAPQLEVTSQELTARGKNNLVAYLERHWSHLKQYFQSGKVARQQWLDTCKSA